ncbi:hypothetical protein EC836_101146 [Erwinia sp. JUb26]|nr:hypothetical protein EC836_101146 [Erwinia sp. JUb26]
MRTRKTSCVLVLMSGLLVMQTTAAAPNKTKVQSPRCAVNQQQINDNNNLLLLGGTAKGPMKQFIVGEFGKDVDQQKRLLGKFDRCGVLTQADISYDKQDANTRLKLDMKIERVKVGWQARYDITVYALRDNAEAVLHHKQGTTLYFSGRNGSITSASEQFVMQGEDGFTETVNDYDRRGRLIRSVARGTDGSSNGEYVYRWNEKNQLLTSGSERSTIQWNYDKQGRELGVNISEYNPFSATTTLDVCQLWDERGNCTLSYSREMEVSAVGMYRRNIAAASRYEYWDQP